MKRPRDDEETTLEREAKDALSEYTDEYADDIASMRTMYEEECEKYKDERQKHPKFTFANNNTWELSGEGYARPCQDAGNSADLCTNYGGPEKRCIMQGYLFNKTCGLSEEYVVDLLLNLRAERTPVGDVPVCALVFELARGLEDTKLIDWVKRYIVHYQSENSTEVSYVDLLAVVYVLGWPILSKADGKTYDPKVFVPYALRAMEFCVSTRLSFEYKLDVIDQNLDSFFCKKQSSARKYCFLVVAVAVLLGATGVYFYNNPGPAELSGAVVGLQPNSDLTSYVYENRKSVGVVAASTLQDLLKKPVAPTDDWSEISSPDKAYFLKKIQVQDVENTAKTVFQIYGRFENNELDLIASKFAMFVTNNDSLAKYSPRAKEVYKNMVEAADTFPQPPTDEEFEKYFYKKTEDRVRDVAAQCAKDLRNYYPRIDVKLYGTLCVYQLAWADDYLYMYNLLKVTNAKNTMLDIITDLQLAAGLAGKPVNYDQKLITLTNPKRMKELVEERINFIDGLMKKHLEGFGGLDDKMRKLLIESHQAEKVPGLENENIVLKFLHKTVDSKLRNVVEDMLVVYYIRTHPELGKMTVVNQLFNREGSSSVRDAVEKMRKDLGISTAYDANDHRGYQDQVIRAFSLNNDDVLYRVAVVTFSIQDVVSGFFAEWGWNAKTAERTLVGYAMAGAVKFLINGLRSIIRAVWERLYSPSSVSLSPFQRKLLQCHGNFLVPSETSTLYFVTSPPRNAGKLVIIGLNCMRVVQIMNNTLRCRGYLIIEGANVVEVGPFVRDDTADLQAELRRLRQNLDSGGEFPSEVLATSI